MGKHTVVTEKRRRLRLNASGRLIVLILAAVFVVLVLALSVRGVRAANEREQAESAAQLAAEQAAAEQAAAEAEALAAAEAAGKESLPDVDTDAWYMRLVRYENPLDPEFVPELTEFENDQAFDSRGADALQKLILDARAAGYSLYFCSGYRSYDTQSAIYWRHIEDFMAAGMTEEEAHATTRLSVNYPGASEHQLGLAADILEYESQPMLPEIGGSGLMLWLEEHCAEYGFIIRYPADKTAITGISYEPWHLRYVGEDAARYIMENHLCLEEFLALYE